MQPDPKCGRPSSRCAVARCTIWGQSGSDDLMAVVTVTIHRYDSRVPDPAASANDRQASTPQFIISPDTGCQVCLSLRWAMYQLSRARAFRAWLPGSQHEWNPCPRVQLIGPSPGCVVRAVRPSFRTYHVTNGAETLFESEQISEAQKDFQSVAAAWLRVASREFQDTFRILASFLGYPGSGYGAYPDRFLSIGYGPGSRSDALQPHSKASKVGNGSKLGMLRLQRALMKARRQGDRKQVAHEFTHHAFCWSDRSAGRV
ncbi:hypothetical protein V8E36_006143 [Tilletia maclaganii]